MRPRALLVGPAVAVAALAVAANLGGCKKAAPAAAAGPVQPATAGKLGFSIAQAARSEPPSSAMRAAQFSFPAAPGDPEGAELVVFYFGAGQGGTVEANLNRWCQQITQDSGQSSCDAMSPTVSTINGLKVTSVMLRGHYRSQDMMTGATIDKPDHGMLAAVVESADGNYFFKLDGPRATVDRWQPDFEALLKSLHPQA